jgi:RNA polymerase sigma factor (sigma-70 family)
MILATVGVMLRQLRQWLTHREEQTVGDGPLLQRFLDQRDETAFALLVERHGAMVLGVCRDLLWQEQDVEDAFQATFLVLARQAGLIRKRASVGSWLHGVAYRIALKARCRRAALQVREKPLAQEPSLAEMDAALQEQHSLVHEELQRLPEKYAAPLVLCCWEGKTQEEAAAQLGWTKGMVKGRLERGKDRLRSQLLRRGVTLVLPVAGTLLAAEIVTAAWKAKLLTTLRQLLTSPATPLPESLTTLMEGAVPPMSLVKTKLLLMVVLLCSLLGFGLVWATQAEPATSAAAHPALAAANTAPQPATGKDGAGEPLPPQALQRLGTVRFRHLGHVPQMAYLPDGKSLVSMSYGSGLWPIKLWNVETGLPLREFIPKQGVSYCFALSTDGRTLAIGGRIPPLRGETNDPWGFINLYEFATGKLQREWLIWKGPVHQMTFSPDGSVLAYVSEGKQTTVSFAHPSDGKPSPFSLTEDRPKQSVDSLADYRRRVPNTAMPYDFFGKSARCAFAPDGQKVLVSLRSGKVVLVNGIGELGSTETTLRGPGHSDYYSVPPLACFSPDGQFFATPGSEPGQLCVWETTTGQVLHNYGSREGPLWDLAFAADSRSFYIVGEAGIRNYDLLTGTELKRWPGAPPSALVLSPDGRTAAAAHLNAIVLHDSKTGNLVHQDQEHRGRIWHLAYSPDGKYLATASEDRTVWLREAATGRPLFHFQEPTNQVVHLAFSPDSKTLAAPGVQQEVWLWDTATGKLLHHLKYDVRNRAGGGFLESDDTSRSFVCFSPDGSECHRFSTSRTFSLISWNTNTGQQVFQCRSLRLADTATRGSAADGGMRPLPTTIYLTWVAVTADLQRMAISMRETTVLLPKGFARTLAGVPVFRNEPPPDSFFQRLRGSSRPTPEENILLSTPPVAPLFFSPDGSLLATGRQGNGPACLWDTATGKLLRPLQGMTNYVETMAFSADGQYLAVPDNSQNSYAVKIFATASGKPCLQLKMPTPAVTLAFSPDRRRLATGHADSTVLVWDIPAVLSPVTLTTPAAAPARTGLDLLWEEMGLVYATQAQAAVQKMIDQPGPAVAFLATKLKPSKARTAEEVKQIMLGLDGNSEVQEKAVQQAWEVLANNDETALEQLRRFSPSSPSLQVAELVETLRRPSAVVTFPPVLQRLRAIQVLERIGTPEARKLLETLSGGMATGRDTRAARAALERLQRKTGP